MSGASQRRHKSNCLYLHRPAVAEMLSKLRDDGRAGQVCHSAAGALLILMVLNATDPGGEIHMSDRSIAAALGCDTKTWRVWARFLEGKGQLECIEKYKNADGWGGWRIVNFALLSGLNPVVQSVVQSVGENLTQQTGSYQRLSTKTYKTYKTKLFPAGEKRKTEERKSATNEEHATASGSTSLSEYDRETLEIQARLARDAS
jgi:hypothetical protein